MRNTPAMLILGLLSTGWAASAAQPDLSKLPPPSTEQGLTYAKDIRPIFEKSCLRCHGEQRPRGGLRLDTLDGVLKGSEDGKVVTPGNSKESQLVIAVARLDPETAMPPQRRPGGGGFGPGMMLSRSMMNQADKNGDQQLSKDEFTGLADTWFDKLDPDHSGKLTQQQFTERFGEVLPPPQGRRAGGPPAGERGGGPARFLAPGFFTAVDADKDGTLTRDELKQTFGSWYAKWDAQNTGALSEEKLRDGLNSVLPLPNFGRGGPGGGRGPGGPGGPNGGPGEQRRPEMAGGPFGPGGPGGPGGREGGPRGGGFGPPPAPLTAEQVGLIRAWIDEGAK